MITPIRKSITIALPEKYMRALEADCPSGMKINAYAASLLAVALEGGPTRLCEQLNNELILEKAMRQFTDKN